MDTNLSAYISDEIQFLDNNLSSVSNTSETIELYFLNVTTTTTTTTTAAVAVTSTTTTTPSTPTVIPIADNIYDVFDDNSHWTNQSNSSTYNLTSPDAYVNDTVCTTDHCDIIINSSYNWFFLILLVFVAGGVLGNTLVCLSICLERRLQNVTNYFLLSLAVADLLVSLVVMPFGIVVGFLGHWPFNATTCNIYITCDVLACSSSIMHMCFISIGRYLGIRNPLKTRHNSKKAVMVKIVLVWLLSMAITSPITILGMIDHENIQNQSQNCSINNRFFFTFGSLFAFYVPMVFMVVSYILTVQLLRQQRKFGDNLPSRRVQLSCRRGMSSSANSAGAAGGGGGNGGRLTTMTPTTNPSDSGRAFRTESGTYSNNGHVTFQPHHNPYLHHHHHHHQHVRTMTCDKGTQTPASLVKGTRKTRLRSLRLNLPKGRSRNLHLKFFMGRRRRSPVTVNTVANEQKASKVLGIVFSTFVVCWTPFFILNIVFAACPWCPVSSNIVDTSLWLGYVSSTINPIIYTIFNRTFKEAFVKILLCRCVFRKKRYSHARIYRYVDNLVHTPSRNSGCVKSPSFPSSDGQESIC